MIENPREVFDSIVESIKEAGYDPYSQLCGYLQNGDPSYITRKGNARQLISSLDQAMLKDLIRTLRS